MCAILRVLENRAQEQSCGNISLVKVVQNDLIFYTGCQEHTIIVIDRDPSFLTAKMAPLTQVTKTKVVTNYYSDSVKCFYVFYFK